MLHVRVSIVVCVHPVNKHIGSNSTIPRILTSVLTRGKWALYPCRKNVHCTLHMGLGGTRNRYTGTGTDKSPLPEPRFKTEKNQPVGSVSFVLIGSLPAYSKPIFRETKLSWRSRRSQHRYMVPTAVLYK